MKHRVSLSAGEARRIALAAQGFDRARPANADDVRHYRRVMGAIGVLQLDFVNVLIPAHFFMIWSRLGAYDRARFESYLYDSGEFTEQWAHEASVVAMSDWPLLAHRRSAFKLYKNSPLRKISDRAGYLQEVLDVVSKNGATTSADCRPIDGPTRKPGDWHRSIARCALEYHFGTGNLAVRKRLKNFQRVYDLPENLVPKQHRGVDIDAATADREMLRKAARSLGVATLHDLADYYRMKPAETRFRVAELQEQGELTEVAVEGWQEPAYVVAGARTPRSIPGHSLLSPFDPVVWFRPRAKRLFDLDYRIEIYVPASKRRWGYYVLPFRQGDEITARVDIKADRHAATLLVQNAHLEDGAQVAGVVDGLRDELEKLAGWLALDAIKVQTTSDFAKSLAHAM